MTTSNSFELPVYSVLFDIQKSEVEGVKVQFCNTALLKLLRYKFEGYRVIRT